MRGRPSRMFSSPNAPHTDRTATRPISRRALAPGSLSGRPSVTDRSASPSSPRPSVANFPLPSPRLGGERGWGEGPTEHEFPNIKRRVIANQCFPHRSLS